MKMRTITHLGIWCSGAVAIRLVSAVMVFAVTLSLLAMPALGVAPEAELDEQILKGADLQYRGRLDEARQVFEQIIARVPENEFSLNQLALIHAKQERYGAAFGYFSKVAVLSPDNTFARIWLGVLALQQGRSDEARSYFTQVLQIDPANANACYFLGVMSAVDRDGAAAVGWFHKAQELGSDDPETHYRLAQAFLSMDMPMNARLEFERTLAINARHTKALHDLGWVLFNQGYGEHAVALWNRVLTVNPDDAQARASLAKVTNDAAYEALRKGENEQAVLLWKKTLQYENGNKAARYYLQKLGR